MDLCLRALTCVCTHFQQDAHEFLGVCLDSLEMEIAKVCLAQTILAAPIYLRMHSSSYAQDVYHGICAHVHITK